jgi:hypothetical protein
VRNCSSSYLILLRIRRRANPSRTFIAHEHTPIDRGVAINNNAVRSTTAGDTKLGGWSGRGRERRADSPDVSINPAKRTSSTTVFSSYNTHLDTRRRDISTHIVFLSDTSH